MLTACTPHQLVPTGVTGRQRLRKGNTKVFPMVLSLSFPMCVVRSETRRRLTRADITRTGSTRGEQNPSLVLNTAEGPVLSPDPVTETITPG